MMCAISTANLRTVPRLEVYPTGANFVLFKIQNGMTATELQTRLLDEHGMYVRDCSNKLGMDAIPHPRRLAGPREGSRVWSKR